MYKIGITEHGDPALDTDWSTKLLKENYDGAIIITKDLVNEKVLAEIDYVNSKKPDLPFILYVTITGYGGTKLEPKVPKPYLNFRRLSFLLDQIEYTSFGNIKDVVLCVDPIIPTRKGIETARNIIEMGIAVGITRFKTDLIKMFPHVQQRFNSLGIHPLYGSSIYPAQCHARAVAHMINNIKQDIRKADIGDRYLINADDLIFESCTELLSVSASIRGYISPYNLKVMGLDSDKFTSEYQHEHCLDYEGKSELLDKSKHCEYKCAYCCYN